MSYFKRDWGAQEHLKPLPVERISDIPFTFKASELVEPTELYAWLQASGRAAETLVDISLGCRSGQVHEGLIDQFKFWRSMESLLKESGEQRLGLSLIHI